MLRSSLEPPAQRHAPPHWLRPEEPMRRRPFLRLMTVGGAGFAAAPWLASCGDRTLGSSGGGGEAIDPRASLYGRWVLRDGLPAFEYTADQEALPAAEWDPLLGPRTRRHWLMVGNRAIRLQAANDGTVALFDESYGLRWLVAPEPAGTGISLLMDGDASWGSAFAQRAGGVAPVRTFGPTWFEVRDERDGLALERVLLCPEGEVPWVLVRVRFRLSRSAAAPRRATHVERWALRPRFVNLLEKPEVRQRNAELAVKYSVRETSRGLVADEIFASPDEGGEVGSAARSLIGPPAWLALERLGDTAGAASARDGAGKDPVLEIETPLNLAPGDEVVLWFRFGHAGDDAPDDPAELFAASLAALAARTPRATAGRAPEAAQEIPWHAALLTGGLCVDRTIGGHSLDQASTYSYLMGFNGASRDPLQHALPLVYIDPPIALSVLRNTCAWAKADGDLPYALDGAKRPTSIGFRPSDSNLWALWLAAEYGAATGDLAAFDAPLAYHPAIGAAAVPLREHLRRQFRFFVDGVGRGERGHVRILNADWNDVAISDSGVDRNVMIENGSSVLNSAMASWVFGVFAALAERLGEAALASEARAQSDELRDLVAQAWNGRWFHRAYAPGVAPIGEADCWLEVQPWALLCGAADAAQAKSVLDTIQNGHQAGSPLGARVKWPADRARLERGAWGESTLGGIWYSINMTLVWAAARMAPDLAWDEFRRMTLAAHTAAYPEIWEGTLSGPDSWNAPESPRPGRTWGVPPNFAMQAFPVNNMHSHAQPLLSYLRLLGVEPTASGSLATGSGGRFETPVFRLEADGHGSLTASGDVVLETAHGQVRGGGGAIRW